MRSFTVTMSYFTTNEAQSVPEWRKSINDLKHTINYLYQTYFPRGLNVNSVLGYSACESTFSFSEIAEILNVHTGGTSAANQNSDVKKYMMNLKPDPPAVSNFPDEPNGWTWAIR